MFFKYHFIRPSSQHSNTRQNTQDSNSTPNESPSVTNIIYKTILNSPKMFRRTFNTSQDESPMSVRSNSPYQKRQGLKLGEGSPLRCFHKIKLVLISYSNFKKGLLHNQTVKTLPYFKRKPYKISKLQFKLKGEKGTVKLKLI